MEKIKGIIFDLDGVICHTDHLHYSAWKHVSDSRGLNFDKEMNNLLRGVSRMESLEIILRNNNKVIDEAEKLKIAEEKNEIYKQKLGGLTPEDVSEDVLKTLNTLKDKKYLLAIGSSSKNTKLILEKLGLGNFFHAVSDGIGIKKSKPDPEVFLRAAKMLGLKPEDCLVVEDAKAGIDAADAGGFLSAGIGDAADYYKTEFNINKLSDLLMFL